jgi:transitional endoplasmic reticulum ATPase
MCLLPMKRAGKRSSVYLGGETGNILAKDVDVDALVRKTAGYVGADIEALVREAKMAAMRDFIIQMGDRSEQERTDAIKNVMLTKAHFDAALQKVRGSLDEDTIEKSERQSWEMLYNGEQREILSRAAVLVSSAGTGRKKTDEKSVNELRKLTFSRRKDFAAISKMTESLEKKMDRV